jgi:hypothetical protein
MIKTNSKKVEVDVLEDVICDSCGNSCRNSNNFEYMTLNNYWGYGSNKDGEMWEAHVCEKCVDEKFKFIKFRKENYMIGGGNKNGLERKMVHSGSIIIIE